MTALRVPGHTRSWARAGSAVRGVVGPVGFTLSVALYVVLSLTARIPPYHPLENLAFFDLRVYRSSASAVVHGLNLYSVRFTHNLSFTYPPFAAALMVVLRLGSVRADEITATVVNIALVAGIAWWSLGLARGGRAVVGSRARRRRIAWLAAAAGLWCEPVNAALGYGQIDVLIAALVVADLSRGDRRGAGVGIGLAAGLKLTPLIFIPYLLLSGRRRAALTALGTFAATVVTGAILLPRDSRAFWWDGGFADTSHVSGRRHGGAGPANQSLRGALLRLWPSLSQHGDVWLGVAAIAACAGLLLAVLAARRGDTALGFVLTAVTGLLVSPVSWTHQWTIAAPGLLLLLVVPWRSRARAGLVALAVLTFAAGSYGMWALMRSDQLGVHLDLGGELIGNLYVIAALALLIVAAVREPALRGLGSRGLTRRYGRMRSAPA